jgi:hypothetical protein
MSAIDCRCLLSGVKRTSAVLAAMSTFDPRRPHFAADMPLAPMNVCFRRDADLIIEAGLRRQLARLALLSVKFILAR